MRGIRRMLDRVEPLFVRGGRLERFAAVYEKFDSMFLPAPDATRGAPHVRDAIDLKRVMNVVLVALLPALVIGVWNVGYQANAAVAATGVETLGGWRPAVLDLFGAGRDAASAWDNLLYGLTVFLPVFGVTLLAAGFWEILFAAARNSDVNEGFVVTATIYALILPPTIPLWQVAVGISFGIVIGQEIFGGTGKNFLNPALLGRAFLYFAYPAQASGDVIWIAVDGYTRATPLGVASAEGLSGMLAGGVTWLQAFAGQVEGSIGETSAAACLVGAILLVFSRVASWRIIVACFLGLIVPTVLTSGVESANPMFSLPWAWHIVLGGFAFGAVYIATDPASSPDTLLGHWIYGILIGVMTWLIRVVNPGYPEGVMLAILLGNVVAPIIDYAVVRANVRRRLRRSG